MSFPQAAPRLPPLAALRHRDFAIYASARSCATLAWQMLNVAVGWHVYALTRDPLDLGLVGLCQFLPFVLLVLPAGQLADRVDRRRVLLAAFALEVICAAILLWLTATDSRDVHLIFAAMALFGCGRAFWAPAGQAMVRNLVPLEIFPSAVAVNSALFQSAVIAGPAVGGVLYLAGPQVVFGTSVALLAIVMVLIFSLRPVRSTAVVEAFRGRDVLDGLRFVFQRRVVLGAISLDLFAVLFGGATALLPIYASDVLHVGPAGLGALRTAPGIGAALTAALLAYSPLDRHVGRWMFAGVGIYGTATVVFGLSTVFGVSLVALLLLGVGDMLSVFIRHTLVQLETPDPIRGRVSAVNSMFIGGSKELGACESGVLARFVGPVAAAVAGGIATLAVLGCYLRLFPELRRMDRLPRPEGTG